MSAVAIVVPTRGRPPALDRALRSIAPQARKAAAELIVVEDGGDGARQVAARHGAQFVTVEPARGPNAARNAGIAATDAGLLVLAEDDVEAPTWWLQSLLQASSAHPEIDVFGGPIRGRIDGRGWRTCGREWPPISSYWRGDADHEVALVFAGNMAIRRSALERVGPFAESLGLYVDEAQRIAQATGGAAPAAGFFGDEEEWQDRYRAAGGRIFYVAAARLDHVRSGDAARTAVLVRAAYGRGRVARRWSHSRGRPPTLAHELRVLVGSAWHLAGRRCMNGLLFAADAAGRVREAVSRG